MAHLFWGTNEKKRAAVRTEPVHHIGGERIRISLTDNTFIEGFSVDLDMDAAENLVKHLQAMIRFATAKR